MRRQRIGAGTGCRERWMVLLLSISCSPSLACKSKGGEPGDGRPQPVQQQNRDISDFRLSRGRLTQVRISIANNESFQADQIELMERELAKELGRNLLASDQFGPGDVLDKSPTNVEAVVEVEYGVVDGVAGQGTVLLVSASASLSWFSEEILAAQESILLSRTLKEGEDLTKLRELVPALLRDAVIEAGAGLLAKEKLRRGDEEEIVRTISSSDAFDSTWAVRVAGFRRITGAYDALLAALARDDEAVSAAAFSALVAIGDPRAVDALTKDIDFQDYDDVSAVVEAVALLGGEEARAFLEFVATGHPDDGLRRRAREAGLRAGD